MISVVPEQIVQDALKILSLEIKNTSINIMQTQKQLDPNFTQSALTMFKKQENEAMLEKQEHD